MTAPVPCYGSRERAINNDVEMGQSEVRTLDIIIECRVFMAIKIQVFESVVCGKVLEKHITQTLTISRAKDINSQLYVPRIERATLESESTFPS